ncbi:MAG: hypothetical protein M3160_00100 [Candidatus Eremiobacteraeota bacterium]|nr:hypothetical protein [Candidatus Eremiobacteraeota bacterium]
MLKAEIGTRRDPVLALELLAGCQDVFTSVNGRFQYYISSGKAYANARNFSAASAMFENADAIAGKSLRWCLSLSAYHRARLRWLMHDFDPHCEDLQASLKDPSPAVKVPALLVRAWMHAGLGSYESQVEDFIAALDIVERRPDDCDAAAVAIGIHSLLRVAMEIGHRAGIAAGELAYERLEWSADIRTDQFQSLRALAWDAFLRGESGRAQWLFKDSKEIAPSRAWKVMAHLDRAYVARMNRNETWASEELLSAQKLARQVTWSETRGEERLALVTLALLCAPVDMAQAQRYVSTYIQLGTESISPTLAVTFDRRAIGFERYASGTVHQILGNAKYAARLFEDAYEIFSAANHHHRASLAALAVHNATGGAPWLDLANEHAKHFPNSPVYKHLHDATLPEDEFLLCDLTAMQRQVAQALCEGLEVKQMSHRFSRSAFTIGKHIEAVYASFGVDSRKALRTELQWRRGA